MVILDKPEDWKTWLQLRRSSADRHGLWEYVDPSKQEEELKNLANEAASLQLSEPKIADVYQGEAGAETKSFGDLAKDAARFQVYQFMMAQFDKKQAASLAKEKKMKDFADEIQRTIAKRHLYLIDECRNARGMLKTLKSHLSQSNVDREYSLLAKYEKLKTMPKRANLEDWLL